MRVLFLDPEALLLPDAQVVQAWKDLTPDVERVGSDPAKDVFARSLDHSRVALLDRVCRDGGVTHVVFASHWRLVWSSLEIAQMLVEAGFTACRKFSSCAIKPSWRATAGVSGWLDEWAEELDSFAALVSDEADTDLAGSARGAGGKLDTETARRLVTVLAGMAS